MDLDLKCSNCEEYVFDKCSICRKDYCSFCLAQGNHSCEESEEEDNLQSPSQEEKDQNKNDLNKLLSKKSDQMSSLILESSKKHPRSMKTGKLQNKKRTLQNCHLTIEQRVEVIKLLDQKMSYRDIAKIFGVSHGTIGNMNKNRDQIRSHQEKYFNPYSKRVVDDNSEVNMRVYEWYCQKRGRNFCISGVLLQEVALKVDIEKRLVCLQN